MTEDDRGFLRALVRHRYRANLKNLSRARASWGQAFDPAQAVGRVRRMERIYGELGGDALELRGCVLPADQPTLELVLAVLA